MTEFEKVLVEDEGALGAIEDKIAEGLRSAQLAHERFGRFSAPHRIGQSLDAARAQLAEATALIDKFKADYCRLAEEPRSL